MISFSRTTALKTAAVLSFVLNTFGVVFLLPIVSQGADAVNQNPETFPYSVALAGIILSVIGIIAAIGAWKQQRWGIILTIVTALLNGLSAVPGLLFAPTQMLRVSAITGVVGAVVIIVLCLWRERRIVTA